jgi:hypothetical protein
MQGVRLVRTPAANSVPSAKRGLSERVPERPESCPACSTEIKDMVPMKPIGG